MTKSKATDETPVGQTSGEPAAGRPTVPSLPARKPMARATRIALFEREVRERLSRAALDLLFARADVMSEGQRALRGGKESFFGSTMLTIDLPALTVVLRDEPDAGTAHRLATLLAEDAGVEKRIAALAAREAGRLAAATLRTVSTHINIRAQGARVFIDVDVEGTF
ncbi:MAG TPA: hypothetical protein VNO55_16985 [Polyangia bacterium]|nr:hypothetical protein [Polyangia bacterium]